MIAGLEVVTGSKGLICFYFFARYVFARYFFASSVPNRSYLKRLPIQKPTL